MFNSGASESPLPAKSSHRSSEQEICEHSHYTNAERKNLCMKKIPIKIIDGTAAKTTMVPTEPDFITNDELHDVMSELLAREPLFHREEFGIAREDFEAMTEPSFWEVGASGERYNREYVIETLVSRYKNVMYGTWHIEDFQCQEIAKENYLVTYTLLQGQRQSRRSTIWRRNKSEWKIVYHQGTLVG